MRNILIAGGGFLALATVTTNVIVLQKVERINDSVSELRVELKTEIANVKEEVKDLRTEVQQVALYKTKERIKLTKEEQECLAKNIFHEAGVDPYEGKIAVAQVTYNRLKAGRWGDNICKVVHAKAQFSWTLKKSKLHEKPKGALWEASVKAAEDLQNGLRVTNLENSQFYHTTTSKASWADPTKKVAVVGSHVFYSAAI